VSYDYEKEKASILTERGQLLVCEALLDAQALAAGNGLIPAEKLLARIGASDSFQAAAVVDRLLELKYIARADYGDDKTTWAARIYRWIGRART
jgi:hypothetical protein